jgi:hypothetical protein
MTASLRLIPIYSSRGDCEAFLSYPYLFNRQGEWIGWVTPERQVYSVHGHYVGWLSDDPRVLRRQSSGYLKPRRTPPQAPQRVMPPAIIPLAPMMPELLMGVFDVLQESPEMLPAIDFGDLKEDMD